jgi:predicted nucleic acid-binding protein
VTTWGRDFGWRRGGTCSTNVLREYFVIVTRKLRIARDMAVTKAQPYANLNLVEIRLPNILEAIKIYRLHNSNFWHSLVVHAAASVGSSRVLSEDLQHGSATNPTGL